MNGNDNPKKILKTYLDTLPFFFIPENTAFLCYRICPEFSYISPLRSS